MERIDMADDAQESNQVEEKGKWMIVLIVLVLVLIIAVIGGNMVFIF